HAVGRHRAHARSHRGAREGPPAPRPRRRPCDELSRLRKPGLAAHGPAVGLPAHRAPLLLRSPDDGGAAAPERLQPAPFPPLFPDARARLRRAPRRAVPGPARRPGDRKRAARRPRSRPAPVLGRPDARRGEKGLVARGPVVVLGGGVAGLAVAHYLARDGWPVTVVERSAALGGLCGSFQSHGFTLDHGPHKLYSVVPGILDEIRGLLGAGLIEHKKRNRIRLLGRYLDYPLSLGNLLPLLGPVRAARLGVGYAAAL